MHLVSFERSKPHRRDDPDAPHDGSLEFEAIEFMLPCARRVGAVVQNGAHAGWVVDLNRTLAIELTRHDVGAPEAEADSRLPADMLAFLRAGPSAIDQARRAIGYAMESLDRYDAPDVIRAGAVAQAGALQRCAPLPRPGKIIGWIAGADEPARLFSKAPSSVIGPEETITLPVGVPQVEFNASLAAVVGTRARRVSRERALDFVAGYCIANDVAAGGPTPTAGEIGRSCDSFGPLGPEIVTTDEIQDPHALALHTTLSGRRLKSGSTAQLPALADAIALASATMTLEPGDVVFTHAGAPSADRPLRDGDIVEIEIESLGRLRNYVTAEKPR